jgi:hypothetical protein
MAREGQERRSKQCQETGGSSLNWAPTAHPKKLAKRERPSTLREESSPEDSPPHGGTPESPDELECLKIRPPVAHTNWEVVNYSKEDPMNVVTFCNKPCYNWYQRREGLMRGSGLSFIKTGTELCSTRRSLLWSSISLCI